MRKSFVKVGVCMVSLSIQWQKLDLNVVYYQCLCLRPSQNLVFRSQVIVYTWESWYVEQGTKQNHQTSLLVLTTWQGNMIKYNSMGSKGDYFS